MRVLHVIPSVSPLRGGPSQAVLAMVREQCQQGVDAAILTTNDDGLSVLTDLPLGRWCLHQGAPLLAFPRLSPAWAPLREFALSPGLLQWLTKNVHNYQLLHVHALFSFPSTAAMAVARRRRVPYILRSIGQLQHWSLRQSAGRKRWMLRLIERRNLEGAAALQFTSALERDEAAALGLTTPAFVLPLGVELPPQTAPHPQEGNPRPVHLLFLSRLHPKKQLPLLLEALALCQSRHPEAAWQLHVAGDGEADYVAQLRQQTAELGLIQHIQWHGFVTGAAKAELLRQADWFLLPSAAENFGIAVAEALSTGVPALLSPGVALCQQVVEAGAGYAVEPAVEPLAASLARHALLPPPPSLRKAARQLARDRFSWPAITTELIGHYQHYALPEACRSDA